MNALVGQYSLLAGVVIAGITVVAAIGAARLNTPLMHRAARWGTGLLALAFGIASAAMAMALYQSDFSIAYVASYTERALPIGYKLSAFWAGQEGSLLFWGLTLALMGAIFAFGRRRDESRQQAIALLILAAITGFFAAMLSFAEQDKLPFSPSVTVPPDGFGLNPMLQNIGMIAHPPTLFVGYAGFTIPFALMIGALVCGNLENWISAARRWVIISWVFLTVGIVLGAQWAYVELGWGGYWAWDPVENASLLPWLTGTALLHSIVVQQHRSMFRLWNVSLAAVTFLLCVFGTYITRSGLIQSVHAFQPSLIADFFLTFMVLTLALCVTLMLIRWRMFGLQPQAKLTTRKGNVLEYESAPRMEPAPTLQGLISKEGAVLLGNALLVFMTVLTLLGTMSPVISGKLFGRQITLQQSFYNTAVLPLAIVILVMMGAAPLLGYGSAKLSDLFRRLRIPLAISIIAAIVVTLKAGLPIAEGASWQSILRVLILGPHTCAFAISLTVCGIAADYFAVVASRWRKGEGTLVGSAMAVLDANHRRYGGHLAHLGMAMIVAGVAGSGLYGHTQELQLETGSAAKVGSYSVRLDEVNEIKGANFEGFEAVVTLTDAAGNESLLKPQIRKYEKSKQGANSEVAFLTNLREDVYVSVLGFGSETAATVQVMLNPLVLWIWIGGIAMTLGGLWAMLPMLVRLRSNGAAADKTEEEIAVAQGV